MSNSQNLCANEYLKTRILIWISIAIIFAAIAYCLLPIRETFEFQGDEGGELVKAYVYHKGFHLYKEIWDDQPPLFTVLVSSVFRCFGVSVFAARLMVLGFSSVLVTGFSWLVFRTVSAIGAGIAIFCLIVSPLFLPISVCVMQEIPTIATALLSCVVLFRWEMQPKRSWLFISGIIMGCAIQIKFTAILLVPAAMSLILFRQSVCGPSECWKSRTGSLLVWSFAILISVSTILFIAGGAMENIQTMFETHFPQVDHSAASAGSRYYPFDFGMMSQHIEVVAAAAFGIFLICWNGAWRRMRFPLVFLATALIILVSHRPFWNFYYLYVSIPMIWLGAYAVAPGLKSLSICTRINQRALPRTIRGGIPFAISILFCLFFAIRGSCRVATELNKLEKQSLVRSDRLIQEISKYRKDVHWFYASEGLYAVYTDLPTPPNLAIKSLKRYWTGQITDGQIFETVERYQPELVLLHINEALDPPWKPFLDSNYILVFQDGQDELFAARRLRAVVMESRK